MLFYFRILLVALWLALCCFVGLLWAVLRWGSLDVDRDVARVFSWGALRLLGLRVEVEGAELLTSSQPCIYVANHQSGLDVVTFTWIYPRRTIAIGKREVIWIPFFGLFFAAAGNVLIRREKRTRAIAGLARAVGALRTKGASIWIFPEGTRNRTAEPLLPFKKGAFHMAIQAGVPIVPILSSRLSERFDWKARRLSRGVVTMRVLPAIPTEGMSGEDVDRLVAATREKMVEALRGLST